MNCIGDEGAGLLACMLGKCNSLTHLDLSLNGIGAEGAGSLARVLGQCKALVHFDLSGGVERTPSASDAGSPKSRKWMARGLSLSFRAITASFRAKTSGGSSLSLNVVQSQAAASAQTSADKTAELKRRLQDDESRAGDKAAELHGDAMAGAGAGGEEAGLGLPWSGVSGGSLQQSGGAGEEEVDMVTSEEQTPRKMSARLDEEEEEEGVRGARGRGH